MLPTALIVVALILAVMHVPMALGRVPPNAWYGFRTPRVVADERAWYPVNRVAGRNGVLLALGLGALGALVSAGWLPVASIALVPFLVIGYLIATFVAASQIVAGLDAGGPVLDLSRGSAKSKEKMDREKLLRKLNRE